MEFVWKYSKKVKMSLSTLETVKCDKHISKLRISSFTCDQKVDWLSHICCQSEVNYVSILTVVKLRFDCISEQHNQENLIFFLG